MTSINQTQVNNHHIKSTILPDTSRKASANGSLHSKATSTANTPEQIADAVGGNLNKYEDQLMQLYKADKPDEGKIAATKLLYDKAMRVFTLFTEMMRNKHELLMTLIRNMGLN